MPPGESTSLREHLFGVHHCRGALHVCRYVYAHCHPLLTEELVGLPGQQRCAILYATDPEALNSSVLSGQFARRIGRREAAHSSGRPPCRGGGSRRRIREGFLPGSLKLSDVGTLWNAPQRMRAGTERGGISDMQMHKLADGIYALLAQIGAPEGDSNSGLVVGNREAALIDCDIRRWDDMREQIREVTDVPIRYLIDTHDNFDHASGNVIFDPGETVIVASEACRDLLARDPDGHRTKIAQSGAFGAADDCAELEERLLPDIAAVGLLTLHLGGRVLDLVPVGHAHTAGDMVVYLRDEKILFAGDVLFEGCHPVARNARLDDWLEVLSSLRQWPISRTVPGHGAIREEYENIADMEDYFQVVRSRVRELKDAGASASEVQEKIDLDEYADWGKSGWVPATVRKLYEGLP